MLCLYKLITNFHLFLNYFSFIESAKSTYATPESKRTKKTSIFAENIDKLASYSRKKHAKIPVFRGGERTTAEESSQLFFNRKINANEIKDSNLKI